MTTKEQLQNTYIEPTFPDKRHTPMTKEQLQELKEASEKKINDAILEMLRTDEARDPFTIVRGMPDCKARRHFGNLIQELKEQGAMYELIWTELEYSARHDDIWS